MSAAVVAAASASSPGSGSGPTVRLAPLSTKQQALLHSLDRRVQLQLQAHRNVSVLAAQQRAAQASSGPAGSSSGPPNAGPDPEDGPAVRLRMTEPQASTMAHFLKECIHRRRDALLMDTKPDALVSGAGNVRSFVQQLDACVNEWRTLYVHAQQSVALVDEMESSHAQVVAKTRALYESFEHVLQQVEALRTRVEWIAAPLPQFLAIESIAPVLGFGVKLARAQNQVNAGSGYVAMPAVQVFQHKTGIDPTTPAFEEALDRIDACMAFLEAHLDYKDARCYLDAYQALTSGAIQCLKDYAISGLEAAKDNIQDAVAAKAAAFPSQPHDTLSIDETSAYYVDFQLVAPSLAAVTRQLQRLAQRGVMARVPTDDDEEDAATRDRLALAEVCEAYATQRQVLLAPVVSAFLESFAQTADILNLLRLGGAYLVRVCEAEFRLFTKLFERMPTDTLYAFHPSQPINDPNGEEQQETAFERLLFQLCALLYSLVRPQLLAQQELTVLGEVIQVLQSELIEGLIAPRASVVGSVAPVLQRLTQDAQERLIYCTQKFLQDEIHGFTPTEADLDYPAKLEAQTASHPTNVRSFYATWYPALERTLLCLSKIYRVVNPAIFEELAQDALEGCTTALKRAASEIEARHGVVHGTLFLVQHLLTLREQITPFQLSGAVRAKALDFSTSADALAHVLSDVPALFRGSMTLFAQGVLPQVQETTADAKKDLEGELKKSCARFLDVAVLDLAAPLLALRRQVSEPETAAQLQTANVQQTLEMIDQHLVDAIPAIRETIHLYLQNASTEHILFQPVERHLLEALDALQTQLQRLFDHDARAGCDAACLRIAQQLRATSHRQDAISSASS